MSKKNNQGKKNEPKVKKIIEEVDVEALNAEAEDLIGADEEEVDDNAGTLPVGEPDPGPDVSEEATQADEGNGAEVQSIFLGFHPITGKKVYS